jgi:TldD protein
MVRALAPGRKRGALSFAAGRLSDGHDRLAVLFRTGGSVVLEVAQQAVEAAQRAGAGYADARFGSDETESVSVKNQEMEGVSRSSSEGLGVRVLVDGYWGFAATSRTAPRDVERAATQAVAIALAAARLPMEPVRLAEVEPVQATWATPIQEDPFAVALEEKVALLMDASARMQAVKGVTFGEANIDAYRRRIAFASSDGAAIEQTIVHCGGGIEATAVSGGEMQRRSYPNSFRGDVRAAGFEHIRRLDLGAEADRVAGQAVELLTAPECPSMTTTLVLDPSQVALQVHESIGHPIELDRVLGMEEAYAGTSFLRIEDRGRLRYGSPLITVVADATIPGGLGTFAYDDEGVPAQRVPVITEGVFENFISSRETAPILGPGARSTGAMRADGWGNLPLIRMTNINLEPGDGTLEDILEDTQDGIYMETNVSWSIDDKRVNFQFGCEVAWRIQKGRLSELYRNPNYTGITTEFWGSCDAVGGRESWDLWGTPNCGKGQPGQGAHVGHAASPARFRGVQVGVR